MGKGSLSARSVHLGMLIQFEAREQKGLGNGPLLDQISGRLAEKPRASDDRWLDVARAAVRLELLQCSISIDDGRCVACGRGGSIDSIEGRTPLVHRLCSATAEMHPHDLLRHFPTTHAQSALLTPTHPLSQVAAMSDDESQEPGPPRTALSWCVVVSVLEPISAECFSGDQEDTHARLA